HWIRAHFWATSTNTTSTPLSVLLQNPNGDPQNNFGSNLAAGDWILKTTIIDPSGRPLRAGAGNLDLLIQYCPNLPPRVPISDGARHNCVPTLSGLVRAVTEYQPASRFWIIQTVETAIFVGLAALLVVVAILAITRRRPT
ncbi:MAG TPA: hypothetical protein VIM17_01180, partial [Jatrophihabitantaceae bacterium]